VLIVSWQDFLIKVGSSVAANKTPKTLLGEFIQVQEDLFRRLDAINQDMQYTLFRPDQGTKGLLDEPWQAAWWHVRQAAGDPARFGEALAQAQEKFLEAYGISRDSLRSSWIAQELAAAYAVSGDLRNAKRWLESAYGSGLKGLKDQLWKAAGTIESATEVYRRSYEDYLKQRRRAKTLRDLPSLPRGLCQIGFRTEPTTVPGPIPFKRAGWYGAFADARTVHRIVQGLDQLFNDLAQLRRACLQAGIDPRDLPLPYDPNEGGIRVASFVPGAEFDTLAYFGTNPPRGPRFSTDADIDVGIELGVFRYIYIEYS